MFLMLIGLIFFFFKNNTINNNFKGSDYGQIYIYVISTPDTGLNEQKLTIFTDNWKEYLKQASYGVLDNVNFIIEIRNSNISNLKVPESEIGTKVKGLYVFSKSYPQEIFASFYENYNSNINWSFPLFSSAAIKSNFPVAWTTWDIDGNYYAGGCYEQNKHLCTESSHELFHALFDCNEGEGNIMGFKDNLKDYNHAPPICLEKIKYYIPQLSIN